MRLERDAELADGTEYMLLGGGVADADALGDFRDRQSFKMPQRESHALDRAHPAHCRRDDPAAVRAGGESFGIRRAGGGNVGDIRDGVSVVHVGSPAKTTQM